MQAVLVRISARLLKKTLLRTDERAKLEGELLDGIDVVKCMTWEVSLLTYMPSKQPKYSKTPFAIKVQKYSVGTRATGD